jgi:tetratricopeptide (TPR) repeat protein/TolB-like protein
MKGWIFIPLILASLTLGQNLSVAFLDFQYKGEDNSKKWYSPSFAEGLRYYLSAQKNVSVMSAKQIRIHRENHKKGNKPADIYQFGDILDIDFLISGDYDVAKKIISITFNVWNIKKRKLKVIRLSQKEGIFLTFTSQIAKTFLGLANPGIKYRQIKPLVRSEQIFGVYATAIDQYVHGQNAKAIYSLRRTLEFSERFSPAHLLLAQLYDQTGQQELSVKTIKNGFKLDPENCEYQAKYAKILLRSGNAKKALQLLKDNKSICGSAFCTNKTFGLIYLEQGFFIIAISYFVKAINMNPTNTELYYLLGKSYVGSENYDKAIELLEKTVKLEPKNPKYTCMLGIAYREANRISRAVKVLEDLLGRQPDYLPATFHLGASYNTLGWHKKALQVLSRALEKHPKDPEILAGLGMVHMHMKKPKAGESFFQKALQIAPKSPIVLNNFGVMKMETKDYRGAAALLTKALKFKKRNAGICYNLGFSYYRLNKLKKAEKYLLLTLESSPGNIEARKLLKDIYERTEDYEKGMAVLTEIINLDNRDYDSKVDYGKLLMRAGQKEQGVGVFEDVVKNNPGNNDYLFLLAEAYKKIQWFDIAILKLERILLKNTKNPRVITLLGEIYYLKALKDRDDYTELGLKSLFHLKKAYNLDRQDPNTVFWYGKILYEYKKDRQTAFPLFQQCLQKEISPGRKKEIKRMLKN